MNDQVQNQLVVREMPFLTLVLKNAMKEGVFTESDINEFQSDGAELAIEHAKKIFGTEKYVGNIRKATYVIWGVVSVSLALHSKVHANKLANITQLNEAAKFLKDFGLGAAFNQGVKVIEDLGQTALFVGQYIDPVTDVVGEVLANLIDKKAVYRSLNDCNDGVFKDKLVIPNRQNMLEQDGLDLCKKISAPPFGVPWDGYRIFGQNFLMRKQYVARAQLRKFLFGNYCPRYSKEHMRGDDVMFSLLISLMLEGNKPKALLSVDEVKKLFLAALSKPRETLGLLNERIKIFGRTIPLKWKKEFAIETDSFCLLVSKLFDGLSVPSPGWLEQEEELNKASLNSFIKMACLRPEKSKKKKSQNIVDRIILGNTEFLSAILMRDLTVSSFDDFL